MKNRMNPKNVFHLLRFVSEIIAIWPLKIGASKTEALIHSIKWWVSFTNVTALLIPLVLGVYYFHNDSTKITQTLSELTALSEIFLNLMQCKIMESKFQMILGDIEKFIERADAKEETILQKYIDRYKNYQLFVSSSFISTAILFSLIPAVSSQILPADAWYPFAVEPWKVRLLLYSTQVLAIFQTGMGICMDLIVATMIWFSAAQVELLEGRVSKAETEGDLKDCARRHRKIVEFTNEIIEGIRFIILKSNVMMTVAIVCGAFQLIQHQPLEVVIRFVLMVVAGCFRLYISAQPANDLKENCDLLARTTIQVAFQVKSPSAAKIALMLAVRCQKPIVLKVSGIMKAYSLQYYATFLSKTVSYFVNLRAILEK